MPRDAVARVTRHPRAGLGEGARSDRPPAAHRSAGVAADRSARGAGGDPRTVRPERVGRGQHRRPALGAGFGARSEEHTSELQSRENLVCRLLLEKKKKNTHTILSIKNKNKKPSSL